MIGEVVGSPKENVMQLFFECPHIYSVEYPPSLPSTVMLDAPLPLQTEHQRNWHFCVMPLGTVRPHKNMISQVRTLPFRY